VRAISRFVSLKMTQVLSDATPFGRSLRAIARVKKVWTPTSPEMTQHNSTSSDTEPMTLVSRCCRMRTLRSLPFMAAVTVLVGVALVHPHLYLRDNERPVLAHFLEARRALEHEIAAGAEADRLAASSLGMEHDTVSQQRFALPVVTYNIRLDQEEHQPDNHFTRRVHRLAAFFKEARPWLAGLQEPFSGQLLHLQSLLPAEYKALGFPRPADQPQDRSHPARTRDFQTAILFDSSKLRVVESDHVWLSERQREEDSKSWGSIGSRTATVAAFALLKNTAANALTDAGRRAVDVIMVNTHLDVWSEPARRNQARLVLDLARTWRQRFPNAVCVVTGDFNAANGQAPHRILLDSGFGHVESFRDAWDDCARAPSGSCSQNEFAATFHGWLGTVVDSWGARLIQYFLQGMHGGGADLPRSVPNLKSLRELARAAWDVLRGFTWSGFRSGLPSSISRMHVDWILHAPSFSSAVRMEPKVVVVAETRDANFSSDHFPVVALFDVRRSALVEAVNELLQ
jgi:endonuclease/exonuclease/phosphatase family metal-dependent hydrolase